MKPAPITVSILTTLLLSSCISSPPAPPTTSPPPVTQGTTPAPGFRTGFNQAWWKNDFAWQWMDGTYDPREVDRMLALVQNAGGTLLRQWLFEGLNSQAIEWDSNGRPLQIKPEALRNIEDFLLKARAAGIGVELTIATGDPGDFSDLLHFATDPLQARWWNIFHDLYDFDLAYRENILKPLSVFLEQPHLRPAVYSIDLANEVDSRVVKHGFKDGWKDVNNWNCRWHKAFKREGASTIPVTTSLGWPKVPFLYEGAAHALLSGKLDLSCVDFIELHLYNDTGTIPNCAEFKSLSQTTGKPILLGEFGQFSKAYDDTLHAKITQNFLQNAARCGFTGAMAWRLSDVRSGNNPEARHSYEAFGGPRPAYWTFKEWTRILTGFPVLRE